MRNSDVRLQWDLDHSPAGGKLARKAIQLGLRGDTLLAYVGFTSKAVVSTADSVRTIDIALDVGRLRVKIMN
jgi:hypothetical protein